jgi:hypothetical protein
VATSGGGLMRIRGLKWRVYAVGGPASPLDLQRRRCGRRVVHRWSSLSSKKESDGHLDYSLI